MTTLRRLIEKLFIIGICLYNTYNIYPDNNLVLYFLITLIFSSLLEIINTEQIRIPFYIGFVLLCIYNQIFLLYIPLVAYDLFKDYKFYAFISIPLTFVDFYPENLILFLFSAYISIINTKQIEIIEENLRTRDKIKEDSLLLGKHNEQLKKDKEKNVHIAILTERNRIAKELHDAIGHAISSSILQVESLKIISKEKPLEDKLDVLQDTLANGMDDIRTSIHNLHNESMDLKDQIERLYSNVPNLDIELVYKMGGDLSYDLKYDILSVVKEGLTNCTKHSNADNLKITLLEQPKFYAVVIKDNGSTFNEKSYNSNSGIGLMSLKEIAVKYNGFVNTSFDKGFKIHMTLMKV